jgi:acetyl-CoA carboxylase carboxyltransferase component
MNFDRHFKDLKESQNRKVVAENASISSVGDGERSKAQVGAGVSASATGGSNGPAGSSSAASVSSKNSAAATGDEHRASVERVLGEEAIIRCGGGEDAIARQHAKGRLTARERIAALVDRGRPFVELGLWAAWEMYAEWGGAASAGVVTGIGVISGRRAMIVANDATVKAGACFPMTIKKILRAQRIAGENALPIVYLVDSSGVFLPLQDEVFPDDDDFGRIFRNNAVLSALGIPQIAAIMGNCVAGGAYLPLLCDTVLMTEGSGLYLAGPALVKAAIGQDVSHDELGGARVHSIFSGSIDFHEPNDDACLKRIRRLAELWPSDQSIHRSRSVGPARPSTDVYSIVPLNPSAQYDMRDALATIVDAGSFDEFKAEYGRTIVTGFARIGGISAGIVANQKLRFRPESGGPMRFGGVIYAESAEKAARFVLVCNQLKMPILFLQDVNGFDVGRDAERSGIIRRGAKLVSAVSNSVVPKITVLIGHSFGAGHYALCGKAFDPRLIVAWPGARYAVMGGSQAARTMLDVQVAALKRQGKKIDDQEIERLNIELRDRYERETDVRYAAARGWLDAIIEPCRTRDFLIEALDIVSRPAEASPFPLGVFQV